MVTNPDETLNHMIRDIIPEVLEKTFTPSIIKASFRATGLYPFDGDTLRRRCRENLGLESMEERANNPLATVEDSVAEQVSAIFKKDETKQKKRKKVLVHLRQPYSSGHIIDASKEEERKKAEEERLKVEKKELAAEKKRQAVMRKEEARLAINARKKLREEIKEKKSRDLQRKKELRAEKKRETSKTKDPKKVVMGNPSKTAEVRKDDRVKGTVQRKKEVKASKYVGVRKDAKVKFIHKVVRGKHAAVRGAGKVKLIKVVVRGKKSLSAADDVKEA